MSSDRIFDNGNAPHIVHVAGTRLELGGYAIAARHLCIFINSDCGQNVLRIVLEDLLTIEPAHTIGDIRLVPFPRA
jgi:hypothetical protein